MPTLVALLTVYLALMMAALGDTLRDALLNWHRGTAFPTAPTTIYLAAFTVAPTSAGGGTEVTGGAYARVAVTLGAPAAHISTNSAQVAWATATANWGTVVAVAIFDASSGGTLLDFANLASSKVVNSGNRLVVDTGQLSLTAA